MTQLKVGPLEANWHDAENYVKQNLALIHGHGLDAPQDEVSAPGEHEPAFPEPPTSAAPESEAGTSLYEASPKVMVEGRWREIEEALRTTVRRADLFPPEHIGQMDFDDLLSVAVNSRLINAATLRSIEGLWHMRNLARSRGGDLTEQQAEDFSILVGATLYAMQGPLNDDW